LKSAIAQTSVLSNGFFCLPILTSEFILCRKGTAAKHQVLQQSLVLLSQSAVTVQWSFIFPAERGNLEP
jgi:hypothetical protein